MLSLDAAGLSSAAKQLVDEERQKFTAALFQAMTTKNGIAVGAQRYGSLLLMATSLQSIARSAVDNMRVLEVFSHFWTVDAFVKELCLTGPGLECSL